MTTRAAERRLAGASHRWGFVSAETLFLFPKSGVTHGNDDGQAGFPLGHGRRDGDAALARPRREGCGGRGEVVFRLCFRP